MTSPHVYSPNNRRTLRRTLSFSGSYGWSLLGISRTAGNAAVYVSMRCRILSAIYRLQQISELRILSTARAVTNMLIDQDNPNVFPLGSESLKCRLDGRGFCLAVHHQEVLLVVWRRRDMLRWSSQERPSGFQDAISVLTPIPARRRPVTESCNASACVGACPTVQT